MRGPGFLREIFLRRPLPEGSYLTALPALAPLRAGERLDVDAPVTFLVGENGSGKSTLLEGAAVALGFNPEGGTRNFSFSTRDTHSELGDHLTVSRSRYPRDGFFLRAESFYNAASYIDALDQEPGLGSRLIDSYGGISLHAQSHGESFLALVQHRFGGEGIYLLDEPEAALSPARQLTLLGELHRLVGEGCQFLIATHSPILMAYPGAQIYLLSERGIQRTAYRETEHYLLTKRFLDDPERMLRYLFSEADTN